MERLDDAREGTSLVPPTSGPKVEIVRARTATTATAYISMIDTDVSIDAVSCSSLAQQLMAVLVLSAFIMKITL